jgi:signal transduction histidine kinase
LFSFSHNILNLLGVPVKLISEGDITENMINKEDLDPSSRDSRHFLRGIASKLVFAVLGAVIIPFLGLVYFIDTQIDTRLKENIVNQSLLNLAGDLANEVNVMMKKRNSDVLLMSSGILAGQAINEHSENKPISAPELSSIKSAGKGSVSNNLFWRKTQTEVFNQYVALRKVYDLILLVDKKGQLVTCSTHNIEGEQLDSQIFPSLLARNYTNEVWFKGALKGPIFRVDHHSSTLIPQKLIMDEDRASHFHIGFAVPVHDPEDRKLKIGIIYALVNWKHIQKMMDVPRIKAYFSGLVKDKEPSPYAWIWGSDANTILAHKDRSLYRIKVSGPRLRLPQMVEDARSSQSGLYREYSYQNMKKNAAFFHCKGPEHGPRLGGFGWIVGVGINNQDIYAMAGQLRRLLYLSTAVVIALVVIWTLVVARRTTRPILALQKHMRKVSQGNLDDQIKIDTKDEISDLADDFNQMIRELKEKRVQLIKAEKNAAWREMARQISHDIKNNLTPLKLSVDLLNQAVKDNSPDYQEILRQTLELIDSQIKNLREIAFNFFEFTGGRKSVIKKCYLGTIITEVLELNKGWARDLDIKVKGLEKLKKNGIAVLADEMKLHRVLTNITSNAFQAMPDGGILEVSLRAEKTWAILEIKDTGMGISDEVRDHLFEPYFTTRTQGTGLGLAIAKRVLEECGGSISLENYDDGEIRGTLVTILLPLSI